MRLIRHQTRSPKGRTPYGLWRDDRAAFEAYQRVQRVTDRARLTASYWASFIAAPDGRTLLAGIYAVGDEKQAVPADWPYPLSERSAKGLDELYTLTLLDEGANYYGGLAIDWGAEMRA